MKKRRFYVTVEIDADTYGDGNPPNDEIVRCINRHLAGKNSATDTVYIQNSQTLSVMDENGKNLMEP